MNQEKKEKIQKQDEREGKEINKKVYKKTKQKNITR